MKGGTLYLPMQKFHPTIRKAANRDVVAVRKIAKVPGLTNPSGEVPRATWFKAQIRAGIFLVAENNKKVVGFVLGEKLLGTAVMIWMIGVTKAFRGAGIGKALMLAFEKECAKLHRDVFVAYAYAKNPIIVKMLRKYGFSQGQLYYEFIKLPKR